MEVNIDAKNLILGRLCAYAAKKALEGNKVNIVNCEDAVVSGTKRFILNEYLGRLRRTHPKRGPFVQRKPDRFVRRTVRGMLPHSQERGKKAFSNVMCYIGIPENLSKSKIETIKLADVTRLKKFRFMRVSEICKRLGKQSL